MKTDLLSIGETPVLDEKKLLRLTIAYRIEQIPDSQWNYNRIYTTEFMYFVGKGHDPYQEHFCGSIGCALGHMAFFPETKHLFSNLNQNNVDYAASNFFRFDQDENFVATPISLFLGITPIQFHKIFGGHDAINFYGKYMKQITQKDVANALRAI